MYVCHCKSTYVCTYVCTHDRVTQFEISQNYLCLRILHTSYSIARSEVRKNRWIVEAAV